MIEEGQDRMDSFCIREKVIRGTEQSVKVKPSDTGLRKKLLRMVSGL